MNETASLGKSGCALQHEIIRRIRPNCAVDPGMGQAIGNEERTISTFQRGVAGFGPFNRIGSVAVGAARFTLPHSEHRSLRLKIRLPREKRESWSPASGARLAAYSLQTDREPAPDMRHLIFALVALAGALFLAVNAAQGF
jgi:hypothetical protein